MTTLFNICAWVYWFSNDASTLSTKADLRTKKLTKRYLRSSSWFLVRFIRKKSVSLHMKLCNRGHYPNLIPFAWVSATVNPAWNKYETLDASVQSRRDSKSEIRIVGMENLGVNIKGCPKIFILHLHEISCNLIA